MKKHTLAKIKIMTIRKTIWLTAIIILPIFSAHAQHFDWVKSYSGQEPTGKFWNYIVSSVTDSHGNLYVAGQFARGASVDGQDLLPFPPHGGEINNPNACIMKISPDGNVYKKDMETVLLLENVTLYAKWTAKEYSITSPFSSYTGILATLKIHSSSLQTV